jgi:MFS family permease
MRRLPMPNPLRRYSPELWTHFLGRIVTASGFSFSFPFFTLYCARHMGVAPGSIGLGLTLSGLAGAGARYLGGELADFVGRKFVMLLALAGRAVTSAGLAWGIHSHLGFQALAASFIASNFFGQLFEPASQAYIADITSGKGRIEAFGFVRTGINAGWGLGMVLSALITDSYVLAFGVTAGVFVVSFAIFALTLREPKRLPVDHSLPAGGFGALFANRSFVLLCAASVLISIVWAQLVPGTSMYAATHAHLSDSAIRFLFPVNGLLVVLLQILATRWIGRIGLVRALVLGCLFFGTGYGCYVFCGAWWQFAACIAVVTFGEVLVAPSGASLTSEIAPPSERGRYLGVYMFASTIGLSLGPLLSGRLLERFPDHPSATWLVVAGIAFASAFAHSALGWGLGVGKRPPVAPEPVEEAPAATAA